MKKTQNKVRHKVSSSSSVDIRTFPLQPVEHSKLRKDCRSYTKPYLRVED
jgi:hypothetical protein